MTLKIEIGGSQQGTTITKLEDTLVTFAAYGMIVGGIGVELDTGGVELNAAPLKKYGC